MDHIDLRGLGVALVTPFRNDGNIDFIALEKVVNHLLDGGVNYIVVLGTTGESATLDSSERAAVRDFVTDRVAGRVPLVLGVGGNCTRAVINDLTSQDLKGYSAVLSVAPYYNKPSQEGLFQHFSQIAEASPLPVILYNVPGRTGVNISASTTLRLAHSHTNIIAVKEASGIFKQIEEIINNRPADFQVISGDDALTYPLMTLGAEGVISVVGNAFPREYGRMVRLCLDGRYKDALPIHYSFSRLYDELFVDGNPAGVKCLLHEMGLIENVLRLPLVPTRLETSEELRKLLNELIAE